MERRLFTKSQADAKVAQCCGRCEGCGNQLPNGFHMHHVTPYSKGGQTRLSNCEALCPDCHKKRHQSGANQVQSKANDDSNASKNRRSESSGFRDLRKWQRNFLADYKNRRNRGERLLNYEATTGAGKSVFCSELGYDMLTEDKLDFVLQVMPWDSIRGGEFSGMTKAYDECGIKTSHSLFVGGARIVAQPSPSRVAFLIMYQSASRPDVLELLDLWKKRGKRFGVIFDEIHHTSSEGGTWGDFAEQISDRAEVTVTVSATYFRTDRTKIRFLKYGPDDKPILSHSPYTYPEAIRDRVVRPVAFSYEDPRLECEDEARGGGVTYSLSELSGIRLEKAKREVLSPDSESVRRVISEVHRHTCDMRRKFPDAAALFTCQPSGGRDEERFVYRVAALVKSITREPVVTVVSSDPKSSGMLEAFRGGNAPYLVAINKVSEGVDVPRLRCVGMLRYLSSEMLFRQIVGRALRYTSEEDGTAAMVVLPKFPVMYQYALNIHNESLEGIRSLECDRCGEHPCVCPCEGCGNNPCECPEVFRCNASTPKRFEVLGIESEHGGGSVGADDVAVRSIEIAKRIKTGDVSHRHTNEVQLAHAIEMAARMSAEVSADSATNPKPLEELGKVTRSVHSLMNRIVPRFFGNDFARAWQTLFTNRYGVDFKEARLTWRTEMLSEFEQVLRSIIREGEVQ